jgi:sterol desaturase/sphingolipid hydroxylase (fatty acid hydroxylase superfamily)
MSFLAPLIWPIPHLFTFFVTKPPPIKPKVISGALDNDITMHLSTCAAALRSCLQAYAAMYLLFDGESGSNAYPAFRQGLRFDIAWMLPILLRNLLAAWIICGFWDWYLYFSPMSRSLHKHKMTDLIPTTKQILHDAFHTTIATVCGSGVEVLMCYGWANGILPMHNASVLWLTIVAGLLTTHWRVNHFYLVHRMLHPWKTTKFPDIGRFLYRHVHSLHHKSYNPTAFSGTSMHPVEATLYYSAALMPVAVGIHPIVAIACLVDCAVGAWLGHDGHNWPGAGDYFHYMHHACFDGNYGAGAPFIPLDRWFGTFLTCKEDLKRVWGNRKSGMEGNDTNIHAPSK